MSKILISILVLSLVSCTTPQTLRDVANTPPAASFVVISDSHGMGQFGSTLDAWLKNSKAPYQFIASGGSAPLQWYNNAYVTPCGFISSTHSSGTRACEKIKTPSVKDVWAHFSDATPNTTTIIVQGTNIPVRSAAEKTEQTRYATALIQKTFEVSQNCIWVGPPNMTRKGYEAADVQDKYDVIKDAINNVSNKTGKTCTLIDSRKHSTYPPAGTGKHDGIHYNWPGSKNPAEITASINWASGIISEIKKLNLK